MGVQLSLFDVSNLAKPVRLDQHAVGANSWTAVESDHHAFLWWAPERLAVIPVVRYDEDYVDAAFAGSLAFRVTRADGIAEVAQLAHPRFERFGDLGFERSAVVGGRLLLVSSAGVLSTFTAAPGPGEFVRFSG